MPSFGRDGFGVVSSHDTWHITCRTN